MRLTSLVIIFGSLLLSLQQGWLSHASTWWREVSTGTNKGVDVITLEGRAVTTVLAARQSLNEPPVLPDPAIQEWLLNRVQSGPADAEAIAEGARASWPQYQELIVFNAHSATADGLLKQISSWPDLNTSGLTHVAAVAQPGTFGLGWSITVLVGQRLPLFTPEALNDPTQEKFYSICGLCQKGQACQIPRHSRSLSLECPFCHRIYAMVAADSRGKFRYVNEYLTGYAPPTHYPRGQSNLAELMSIWRAVTSECRYTPDAGDDDNDAWQTAQETQALGTGDCEDSSILLADWLLSRGFQARVALGRYAERGGHAWVVVRLDGRDYLLESTEGTSGAQRPPLLSEVGSRYVPELLFDPLTLFIRTQPHDPWNGDFWGETTWQRVTPRARPAKDDTLGQAQTEFIDRRGF
jgi:hypothetical protein